MAKYFQQYIWDDPYSTLESILGEPTLNNDTEKSSSVLFSDLTPA